MPHKGWTLEGVYDVREEGQSADETDYETCMMCNNERIRYVHVVSHDEVGEFKVGCVCAEKMTNDYINPKRLETALRNKASKRTNWIKRKWKINNNGNHYLSIEGNYLLIYKKGDKYKCKIKDTFGHKLFDTIEEAKMAAFNGMEYMKEKNKW